VTGFLWAVLGFVVFLGMAAIGDMVSEEIRDRLDHLPQAILRLAARRLDPKQRAALYEEVWLPDLAYYLKGDEARPVTRLYHGIRFTIGILVSARQSGLNLGQPAPERGVRVVVDPNVLWSLKLSRQGVESLREIAFQITEQEKTGAWVMYPTDRAGGAAPSGYRLIFLDQQKQEIQEILGRLYKETTAAGIDITDGDLSRLLKRVKTSSPPPRRRWRGFRP
jgi:hypothetical protein